jgi:hypothetical protein
MEAYRLQTVADLLASPEERVELVDLGRLKGSPPTRTRIPARVDAASAHALPRA